MGCQPMRAGHMSMLRVHACNHKFDDCEFIFEAREERVKGLKML